MRTVLWEFETYFNNGHVVNCCTQDGGQIIYGSASLLFSLLQNKMVPERGIEKKTVSEDMYF